MTETKLDYTPAILSYKDDGFTLDEINEFIDSVELFAIKAKEQYKDGKVRLFFLPEGMVSMAMAAQGEE